jgi:HEAT repeat protein
LLNAGNRRRFPGRLAGLGLLCLSLAGCANAMEELTRHDISFGEKVHNVFAPSPDPLVVLRDSHDGDQRARAMRALKEPKENGGNDRDQEAVLAILVTSSKSDPQPLCRVAAIQSLGRFKDPRAAQALIDSYYSATVFTPETTTVVQCAALTALGETRHPAAVDLLTRVVRAPAPASESAGDQDKEQEQDRRIAAARALGNFSHYQAVEALVSVLRTDKDAAIRNRAHESLVQSTGKDLGTDPGAWDKLANAHAYDSPVPAPKNKLSLTGWSSQQ